MKLLHLGDLHIGKSVNDYNMIEDQEYILNQILDIATQKEVDAVLIAGDVYDKSVPGEDAVRVLNDFLCRLVEKKIPAYMISGNHDSDERLNFGSRLFETNGIYISSKYTGSLYKQTVWDEYGPVNIYLLPFVKASRVKHFFPDAEIDSYDKAVRVALQNENMDNGERNVLVAHQFVAGKSEQIKLSGSENASVQNVGAVEIIGADCFDAFDYVALGHIHAPQKVGRDEVRYAGSPLKYSLSELNNEKSVPLITLGEKGNVTTELLPLKPLRDMRHLKGKLEQLLEKENLQSPEDYIYVTLTDEDPIADAISIIRQYYPNTMKLDYDNAHTRQTEQVDITHITAEKTFPELISDFYLQMYGCEISEEELALMLDVAGEAGVVDETH